MGWEGRCRSRPPADRRLPARSRWRRQDLVWALRRRHPSHYTRRVRSAASHPPREGRNSRSGFLASTTTTTTAATRRTARDAECDGRAGQGARERLYLLLADEAAEDEERLGHAGGARHARRRGHRAAARQHRPFDGHALDRVALEVRDQHGERFRRRRADVANLTIPLLDGH